MGFFCRMRFACAHGTAALDQPQRSTYVHEPRIVLDLRMPAHAVRRQSTYYKSRCPCKHFGGELSMRGTASRCVARYQRTALRYIRRRFSPCRGRFCLECAADVAQHRQHMLHECSAAMLPASDLSASITPFTQVSTLSLGCAAAAANLHSRRNRAVGVLELPTGRSSARCVPYI